MANLFQDIRYALRRIRRAPGFSITAVLTLALGIGATTAIFSFVDGVLLRPLAYRDSGRLVVVWERVGFLAKLMPYTGPNPKHVSFWKASQSGLSDLAMVNEGAAGVSLSGDHPLYVGRVVTEPNLFDVLGVQPVLGRGFLPGEGRAGTDDRAVVSFSLWQQLFAGRADVVGQTLQVNGAPKTVVGVLPRGFYFPKANELTSNPAAQQSPAVDLFLPNIVAPGSVGWNSDYGNYAAIGHLQPGVTVTAAQARLDAVSAEIIRQAPASAFGSGPDGTLATFVQPLKQAIVGKTTGALWLLLSAVLSLLLIACTNLANAQLARVMARDREAALRTALGASAWNLVQASLVEAALLATAGGVLGIAFARAAVQYFASFVQVAIPRAGNIHIDGRVLALALGCTAVATVMFGALPALRFLRARPQLSLGGTGRLGSAGGTTLRRVLVGVQMLLCTSLLLLTGVFARNLLQLLRGDKGFQTGGSVVAGVRLQGAHVPDSVVAGFEDGMLDRLRTLPGVSSAALVSSMLSQGQTWVDGVAVNGASEKLAQYRWISPDYFATIGQPILAGRAIQAQDRTPVLDSEPPAGQSAPTGAAVVSSATANAVWPQQDPVGRHFKRDNREYVVVGVAADARTNSPRDLPPAMVFLPYWDNPPARAHFLVHGAADPLALAVTVRKAIGAYNPGVTIADVRPFDAELADTLAPERLQTTLLACFGGAALLLALLGIYGTLSYSIGRRTQEIGVRMALGASRANVYRSTLQEVAVSVVVGLAAGWLVSLAITRVARSLLQEGEAASLPVTLAIVGTLLVTAFLAGSFPCWRAARIDPMAALRAE